MSEGIVFSAVDVNKDGRQHNCERQSFKESNIQQEVKNKIAILAQSSMKFFLRQAFSTLNPTKKLHWNWHLDYLCDILEEVYKGNIKRLLINIPPRYLKSVICSVCFPAWVLGRDPSKRIIVASYSKILATKHSTDTRQVVMANWYKKLFPKTIIANGMNEKNKFCTTRNGFRFATSVNGTLTGEGGDILIVDDPHNPVNIFNKSNRKKTKNWFSGVFSSRLNNKKTGAIIVVMQRLHMEDLSGYILQKDNEFALKYNKNEWFCVCLPAIADGVQKHFLYEKLYKVRKDGDVLFPEMEPKSVLDCLRRDLGEYNFEAQYQQNPIALDGNLIKKSWLKYFEKSDLNNLYKEQFVYYVSLDCASGVGTENDFTAISVFIVEGCKFYLWDLYRLKIAYPDLKSKIIEILQKYKPLAVLIEDKSNGASLIQDLSSNYSNIIAIKPTKSKEFRVNSILTTLEAGNLLIAKNQDWVDELEVEMLSFPVGKHDDQVDSISQFINWFNLKRRAVCDSPKIRKL